MDLEQAWGALYDVPPEGFVARRDELARELRAAGEPDLARQVHDLRRPTLSAWAVNVFARERRDDVASLTRLAAELREAQAGLSGDRIRALSSRRQQLTAELGRLVTGVAAAHGRSLSVAAQEEVRETLTAALASAAAAEAVTSGLLTRPLSYAGFGEVDVTAATATPLTGQRASQPRQAGSERKAADAGAEGQRAHEPRGGARERREAREAEDRAQRAAQEVAAAELAVERSRARREAITAHLAGLREQLDDAAAELRKADAELSDVTERLKEAEAEAAARAARFRRQTDPFAG